MAARIVVRGKSSAEAIKIVRCSDCVHFRRDTEGISRSVTTGEYFMGVCKAGLHPDSPIKQFANKYRLCNSFK
jgi:hypothetical protein